MPETKNKDLQAYRDCIERMNAKHAILMIGGKCAVMNEIIDPAFNRPDVTFSGLADLRNFYSANKIKVPYDNGTTSLKSIASAWLEHPQRRQYNGIVFSPGADVDGFYNLWRGFAVQPRQGIWDRTREHIYDVICGGSDLLYDYLIAWMADIVTRADIGFGEKPGVAVVMRGGRGAGKGTFAQAFGGIFGNHFLHVTSPTQFIGRFNQHLKDCLVLFADEAFWAGDKTGEGILKALITEKTTQVEQKGKDAFTVVNHVNLIIASNNDWIVPAGMDERRFFVLEVKNDRQQDHAYFDAIHHELEYGGREAMLYDLLAMKPGEVSLKDVPQTEGLVEQKLLSADSVTEFWHSRLCEGTQLKADRVWSLYVETAKLHGAYVAHCQDRRFTRIEGSEQFSKKLRKLCPHLGLESPGITGPRYIRIEGSRRYALEFPDLAQCRTKFEQAMRYPVQWPEED